MGKSCIGRYLLKNLLRIFRDIQENIAFLKKHRLLEGRKQYGDKRKFLEIKNM